MAAGGPLAEAVALLSRAVELSKAAGILAIGCQTLGSASSRPKPALGA